MAIAWIRKFMKDSPQLQRYLHLLGQVIIRVTDVPKLFRHVALKVIGPVLAFLIWFLVIFVAKVSLVDLLPELQGYSIVEKTVIVAVGIFMLANMAYNYFKASWTDAGKPPDHASAVALAIEHGVRPPPQCARCHLAKPQRAHHCGVCRRCVMKMDHHCPWLNNCVGAGNYRFFYVFLLWSVMLTIYVMYWVLEFCFDPHHVRHRAAEFTPLEVVQLLARNSGNPAQMVTSCYTRRGPLSPPQYRCASVAFILTFVLLFVAGFLSLLHTSLLLSNLTTIEAAGVVRAILIEVWATVTGPKRIRTLLRRARVAGRNPYDLGPVDNFYQVFGHTNCLTLRWMFTFLSSPGDVDCKERSSVRLGYYARARQEL
mmetsp:Transcript_10718/g.24431  ORF Transcript_10718/g.24431 Transcript_10718/m.24431 type:complete len:370 (+) Transcript_10718:60-1169(+)